MYHFLGFLVVLLDGLGAGEWWWRGSGSRWRSVKVCDPCLEGKLSGELQNPPNFKINRK